ncbi:MAG: phage tail sheath subtilisin-like domain-containing protein [Planctomycetota bacterium]|nr:phage tail sheath subtilisin-like domain-containing protein [Planctomycetota bacterium]
MPISMNDIPNNIRVPFVAVEFDSTKAIRGAQFQPYKALLIGQKLSAGVKPDLIPARVNGKSDAERYFGAGSMLAEMADYYRRSDGITELWAISVPDTSVGASAAGTVTFTGAVVEAGVLNAYVGGRRFTVPVNVGDTPANIATTFAAAVNGIDDLPTTAASDEGVVTLTARHPGLAGNGIDVRFNYNGGEEFPAGLLAAVSPMAGGTANPNIAAALQAVSGEWFNAFVMPYSDANNLYLLNQELVRRWGPLVMQEGWLFGAVRGTHGELGVFGAGRNSKHECFMHAHGVPNNVWAIAASAAANAMYYGNIDPARPFQTLPLTGILPPAIQDRFTDFPENNQLLYDGISTFMSGDDGIVRIGRLVTTYKTNERGADDASYLDLNTGLTLGYLRWDLRNHLLRKFPRHKLGNDGVRHSDGAAIVTPKIAKAECIVKARDWEERGLVENVEQFKDELIVERNASDPNRLDFLVPPDLMNQFIVGAVKIQFYL